MRRSFTKYKDFILYALFGLIFLGLLVFDVVFFPMVWAAHKNDSFCMKKSISQNEDELAKLKTENEILTRKIEYFKTDAGAEEMAREMGMIGEGEITYVVDADKFAPLEVREDVSVVPKDYKPLVLHKDPMFKLFDSVLF